MVNVKVITAINNKDHSVDLAHHHPDPSFFGIKKGVKKIHFLICQDSGSRQTIQSAWYRLTIVDII